MSDALSCGDVRNIIVLGKTGVGKSATLNTLLGQEVFRTGHGGSVTSCCNSKEGTIDGMKVRLIDTPGEKDTKQMDISKEIDDYILKHTDGINLFVLVLSVSNRPTKDDIDVINQVQKLLGPGLEKHLMIIVTRAGELENGETLEGFLQSYASQQPIVAECLKIGRVLGFENGKGATAADKKKQLKQFTDMTQKIIKANGGSFYTHAQLKRQIEKRKKEEAKAVEEKQKEMKDLQDRLKRTESELSALQASASSRSFLSTAGTCAGNMLVASTNVLVGATELFAVGATGLVVAGAAAALGQKLDGNSGSPKPSFSLPYPLFPRPNTDPLSNLPPLTQLYLKIHPILK